MKKQSTSKGFAILSAAGMLSKVISILYVPFLTKIIGPDGWGVYQVTYTIFTFGYTLANIGIPIAISKIISELSAQDNYKDAVKTFNIARVMLLILGVVIAVAMALLSYPVAKASNEPRAAIAVAVLAPCILITTISSSYKGYFQGRGNMTPTAISQVGEQIINTIFSLVGAAVLLKYGIEYGVAGATTGTTLGALFVAIYLMIEYQKNKAYNVPKGVEFDEKKRLSTKAIIKKIVGYATPMVISVGLSQAGGLVDMFNVKARLLVSGVNSDLATIQFGKLGLFTTLMSVPLILISSLSSSVLPAISGAIAVNDKKTVQDKINFAMKLCFIVSMPAAVGIFVLSKPIFYLFGGSSFYCSDLLKYGAVVIILNSVVQIETTILQSLGKFYVVVGVMAVAIICKIVANYTLIPGLGIDGAIAGYFMLYFVPMVVNRFNINRALKVKIGMISRAIKPAISAVLMGGVVYLIYFNFNTFVIKNSPSVLMEGITLLISVPVGVLVYAVSLVLIGGITKEDLNSFSPKLVKKIPSVISNRMK